MTDTALLGGDDDTAAQIPGYGPVPAPIARALAHAFAHTDADTPGGDDGTPSNTSSSVGGSVGERARIWIRRLYTDPVTGVVRDCDTRRRRFDHSLARLLFYRDGGTCRDSFCDAPIREYDHIHPYAAGGDTTTANGRGVCQRGNHTRQLPGWTVRVIDPDRH
ncbi:HNH endonuclease, partial [Phytoactinopolyspora endophytica]|uniref:HNH endonuclease n=1 Tax=Phytoactinopolyspora endophytica TaxID=1642495 RepID=UPI001F0D0E71